MRQTSGEALSATPGSVAFNFDRKGVIQVEKGNLDEEVVFATALESGAEDFEATDETFMVTTDPTELFVVRECLEKKGWKIEESDIEMIPKVLVACDAEAQASNLALIEWIDELDDVDTVYHNMDLS